MDADTTDQLIKRIAGATTRYPFKVWGFGESIAMEGLLAAGSGHRDFAASLITTWARQARPLHSDPLAHVAPGVPLLMLYDQSPQPVLLERARELAAVLASMCAGASGARLHRPDLAGWEHEVWVDCMHLDGPFLAKLGAYTGEAKHTDLAAELLLGHARVLQDSATGLFSHGFDDATAQRNGIHWGRGQGWALLGLVDTLRYLPDDHVAREEIEARLSALVAGLAATEQEPGQWATAVDHPETYREPSVSAFIAFGVARAVRHGFIAGSFRKLADRAWHATRDRLTPTGELLGVSDATPVGSTVEHYDMRARGVFPWGQGPALLAAIERPSLRSTTTILPN